MTKEQLAQGLKLSAQIREMIAKKARYEELVKQIEECGSRLRGKDADDSDFSEGYTEIHLVFAERITSKNTDENCDHPFLGLNFTNCRNIHLSGLGVQEFNTGVYGALELLHLGARQAILDLDLSIKAYQETFDKL